MFLIRDYMFFKEFGKERKYITEETKNSHY